MNREAATQIASHCSCGSPLRWETREDCGQRRSLALCRNPDCGAITTHTSEKVGPARGLESFLLGNLPVRRYLQPWARLYFRTVAWGYRWRPYHEVCPDCTSEVTVQLDLSPSMERQTDPYEIVLCLTCGATGMAWWLGERTAIAIDGSEWDELSTAVLILKRVLEERAAMARERWSWDFQ